MKAVFFDFDGVLTLDPTGSHSICHDVSKQSGIDLKTFSAAYRKYNRQLLYGEKMHRDIWDGLCRDLGAAIPYTLLYESFLHTPIDLDMLNLVKAIRRAGIKTGMITDNKRDRIDAIRSFYNWYSLFDAVAVSAALGSGKSNPDIFHWALHQIGAAPTDCIFIDNSAQNLVVPRAMGIHTILYDDARRDFLALLQALRALGVPIDEPNLP
ncbi:MAG: HAD-IA family hydrolase [Christensenellales bacterium]